MIMNLPGNPLLSSWPESLKCPLRFQPWSKPFKILLVKACLGSWVHFITYQRPNKISTRCLSETKEGSRSAWQDVKNFSFKLKLCPEIHAYQLCINVYWRLQQQRFLFLKRVFLHCKENSCIEPLHWYQVGDPFHGVLCCWCPCLLKSFRPQGCLFSLLRSQCIWFDSLLPSFVLAGRSMIEIVSQINRSNTQKCMIQRTHEHVMSK